jgi:hypothetical protein
VSNILEGMCLIFWKEYGLPSGRNLSNLLGELYLISERTVSNLLGGMSQLKSSWSNVSLLQARMCRSFLEEFDEHSDLLQYMYVEGTNYS